MDYRRIQRRVVLRGKAPTHAEPDYRTVADPVRYSDEAGEGMAFAVVLEIATDGRVDTAGDALGIAGATHVEIRIAAGTGVRGFDRVPDRPTCAAPAIAPRPTPRSPRCSSISAAIC